MDCFFFFLLQTWTPGWAPGSVWIPNEAVSQAGMKMFLLQTWTPGWARGSVWVQKMLLSHRNELLLVQIWTPGCAPGPVFGPKGAVSQTGMNIFSPNTELNPWLSSRPRVVPKILFSNRNELFLIQTWTPSWAPRSVWTLKKAFSSRNELFISTDFNPWLSSWSCVGTKKGCSQLEISCFGTDLNLWQDSWPGVDPKETVLKQKWSLLVQTWSLGGAPRC